MISSKLRVAKDEATERKTWKMKIMEEQEMQLAKQKSHKSGVNSDRGMAVACMN